MLTGSLMHPATHNMLTECFLRSADLGWSKPHARKEDSTSRHQNVECFFGRRSQCQAGRHGCCQGAALLTVWCKMYLHNALFITSAGRQLYGLSRIQHTTLPLPHAKTSRLNMHVYDPRADTQYTHQLCQVHSGDTILPFA